MPQDNNQTILSKRHDEDCLGCRLVSGFGVLGMGVYLFNTGQKQTTRFNRRAIILLSFGNLFCFFFLQNSDILCKGFHLTIFCCCRYLWHWNRASLSSATISETVKGKYKIV